MLCDGCKNPVIDGSCACPSIVEDLKEQLCTAKQFIRALILAHKETKSRDHYQITGDARRFIGMD